MTVYYNPPLSKMPHSQFKNALWVIIEAYEVDYQSTVNRGGEFHSAKGPEDVFEFLAPVSLQEIVSHNWEAYDTMTSRASQFVKSVEKGVSSGRSTWRAWSDLVTGHNPVEGAGSVAIPKSRIDTPLVYTDSRRREYPLTFNLVAWSDPHREVLEPIKRLQILSSPEIDGIASGIKLPYIFKIRTTPSNIIKVNQSALQSVQPTYFDPYIDGAPIRAELQLNFIDLTPVYRSTIESGGSIIKVVNHTRGIKETRARINHAKAYESNRAINRKRQGKKIE